MSHQCVPSWDIDDETPPFAPHTQPLLFHHNNLLPSVADVVTPADYEVAELTWKDGNLAMLGLRHPPRIGKPTPRYPCPAASTAGGTLECIVDQARGSSSSPDHLSWVGDAHRPLAVDVLVPSADRGSEKKRQRFNGTNSASQGSAIAGTLAATVGNGESTLVTVGTCEVTASVGTDDVEFSPTPWASPASTGNQEDGGDSPEAENGSFAGTKLLGVDDQDSISHNRSEQDAFEEKEMASVSTKRSRVAAVHNQSERKRRDRINQKMKTLQKLLPKSSKTDKASMLDEVIEYLKLLQAQLHMMSRMRAMSPIMMPITMQQLQLSMMASMARMPPMGMGMIDPTFFAGHGNVGLAPPQPMLHPSPFIPLHAATVPTVAGDATVPDWMQQPYGRVFPEMFLPFMGCPGQQQPMSTEAYSRMAALYQQLYGFNHKF